MHYAWWWNNAVDAPHCAQTAVKQNLCCVTAQSGAVRSNSAWWSLLMNGRREESRELLNTSMSHSIWHFGVTLLNRAARQVWRTWRCDVWHLCGQRAGARICVCDPTGRKEQRGRRQGWVLYFPLTFVWWTFSSRDDNLQEMNMDETWCHILRVCYFPLFQVSTSLWVHKKPYESRQRHFLQYHHADGSFRLQVSIRSKSESELSAEEKPSVMFSLCFFRLNSDSRFWWNCHCCVACANLFSRSSSGRQIPSSWCWHCSLARWMREISEVKSA